MLSVRTHRRVGMMPQGPCRRFRTHHPRRPCTWPPCPPHLTVVRDTQPFLPQGKHYDRLLPHASIEPTILPSNFVSLSSLSKTQSTSWINVTQPTSDITRQALYLRRSSHSGSTAPSWQGTPKGILFVVSAETSSLLCRRIKATGKWSCEMEGPSAQSWNGSQDGISWNESHRDVRPFRPARPRPISL